MSKVILIQYLNDNIINLIQKYTLPLIDLVKNNKNKVNIDINIIGGMSRHLFEIKVDLSLKDKIKYFINENKYNICNCVGCSYKEGFMWQPKNLDTDILKYSGSLYHDMFHVQIKKRNITNLLRTMYNVNIPEYEIIYI